MLFYLPVPNRETSMMRHSVTWSKLYWMASMAQSLPMDRRGQERHSPCKVLLLFASMHSLWCRFSECIQSTGSQLKMLSLNTLNINLNFYTTDAENNSYELNQWCQSILMSSSRTHAVSTVSGVKNDPELRGVIPNSFEHIFQHIARTENQQYLVRASYLEIYMVGLCVVSPTCVIIYGIVCSSPANLGAL